MCDLSIKLGKLSLKNPIMPASGTFGYGIEFKDFIDLNKIGAIVTKGISINPKVGNPPPRIFEGDNYLMNYIGLENIGFFEFKKNILPKLTKFSTPIIVNCFGNYFNEYIEVCEKLNELKEVSAIEVNISCPNVEKGGLEFGTNPDEIFKLIKEIRKVYDKFLIVKISPVISDIIKAGKLIEEAGADAITAINTIRGIRIDIFENKIFRGSISGKLLKPVALRIVKELSDNLSIPIIGCGGIEKIEDVIEFIKAGAKAVQIGTMNLVKPNILVKLVKNLKKIMELNKIKNIEDLRYEKIKKIN